MKIYRTNTKIVTRYLFTCTYDIKEQKETLAQVLLCKEVSLSGTR